MEHLLHKYVLTLLCWFQREMKRVKHHHREEKWEKTSVNGSDKDIYWLMQLKPRGRVDVWIKL